MFGVRIRISWEDLPRTAELFAALLSPFILLSGAFLLRRHVRLGYGIVAAGALLPLPWLFITESRSDANSWIALNASWNDPDPFRYMHYCELRIISAAFLVMTLTWAGTRLLPASWQLLGNQVNRFTWPSITLTLTFVVYWFATYAFPYRQPIIVDGAEQMLGILHVEKNATAFRETRISIFRDGRYFVIRNEHRLFHYRFVETTQGGLLTDSQRAELKAILDLPELKRTLDVAPRPLRAWRGEGWYTIMGSYKIAAFTSENEIPPPRELPAFLSEIEKQPPLGRGSHYDVRDICLGFCYDPVAGLGYVAENERCAERPNGKEICY
jgi:hypothetical protein